MSVQEDFGRRQVPLHLTGAAGKREINRNIMGIYIFGAHRKNHSDGAFIISVHCRDGAVFEAAAENILILQKNSARCLEAFGRSFSFISLDRRYTIRPDRRGRCGIVLQNGAPDRGTKSRAVNRGARRTGVSPGTAGHIRVKSAYFACACNKSRISVKSCSSFEGAAGAFSASFFSVSFLRWKRFSTFSTQNTLSARIKNSRMLCKNAP